MSSYLGEIRLFAGNYAPQGWSLCNGAVLSIADNASLYEVIGKTYGGDGISTFALPNLTGSAPVHIGTDFPLGATGSGPIGLGATPVSLLYIINTTGVSMEVPYVGEVRAFAFGSVPRDWLECNGQLLEITSNTALYSLLDTRYGGDGNTTFGLPDLTGAVAQDAATAATTGTRLGYLVMNFCIASAGNFPPKP